MSTHTIHFHENISVNICFLERLEIAGLYCFVYSQSKRQTTKTSREKKYARKDENMTLRAKRLSNDLNCSILLLSSYHKMKNPIPGELWLTEMCR